MDHGLMKLKTKIPGAANWAVFLLKGRLLSRAIERRVDQMSVHVVWNSVS